MILIVFGEMASGKNFVGELIAFRKKGTFFDGDDVLPMDLRRKVARGLPLTILDVDRYVSDHLIPAIKERYQHTELLVVAQALYSKKHRDLIAEITPPDGIRFIYIPNPPLITHFKRLWNRDNGFWWVVNALMSKPFFQKPKGEATVIKNDETLDSQIKALTW